MASLDPHLVDGKTGGRIYGSDYYQNLILWALPAAIEGKDLAQSCAPGAQVDRVIKAGELPIACLRIDDL